MGGQWVDNFSGGFSFWNAENLPEENGERQFAQKFPDIHSKQKPCFYLNCKSMRDSLVLFLFLFLLISAIPEWPVFFISVVSHLISGNGDELISSEVH